MKQSTDRFAVLSLALLDDSHVDNIATHFPRERLAPHVTKPHVIIIVTFYGERKGYMKYSYSNVHKYITMTAGYLIWNNEL